MRLKFCKRSLMKSGTGPSVSEKSRHRLLRHTFCLPILGPTPRAQRRRLTCLSTHLLSLAQRSHRRTNLRMMLQAYEAQAWFGVKLLHHPMPGPGKPQMLSMPQGSAIRSCPRPVTQVWTCSRYTRSFAHVQIHPFQSFWSRRTAVRGKNTLLQGVLWILRMDGAK